MNQNNDISSSRQIASPIMDSTERCGNQHGCDCDVLTTKDVLTARDVLTTADVLTIKNANSVFRDVLTAKDALTAKDVLTAKRCADRIRKNFLQCLVQTVWSYSEDIGMKFGIDKCAVL